MEKIIAKLLPLKVEALKEMAVTLNTDLSAEASIVLGAVLDVLSEKIGEEDFVAFADAL